MAVFRSLFLLVAVGTCALLGYSDESARESSGSREQSIPAASVPPEAAEATSGIYNSTIRPVLSQYCFRCHGEAKPRGDLNLAAFRTDDDVVKEHETWQRVWEALRRHEMPPKKPFPTIAERQKLLISIAKLLDRAARDGGREPGHVVLRRLNQVEYNNTVLDLFGTYRATRTSGGTQFDPQRGMPEQVRVVLHRDARRIVVALPPDAVAYGFTNIGEALALPPFLMEKYLTASRQVIDELVDQQGQPRNRRKKEKQPVDPRKGARKFVASLSRRAFGKPMTDGEIKADPAGSARKLIAAFGRRAFRRPMNHEEIRRYLKLYQAASKRGEPFEKAVRLPVQAMLVSPHFLFRVEHGIEEEQREGLRPLNSHELATRLSYFLWSTMPDETLFRLADAGKLRDPEVLEAQARRMLRHRFSKELAEQFGMQWLELTGIRAAMPFPDLYPEFYRLRYLPEAMQMEAILLFETILVEDRSVLDFLDPGFTWMNKTLIDFYELKVKGADAASSIFWRRYQLPDKRRGGVLTMGGTMLATSLAARTSPVKRGKWVLDNILGAPPPPPPPNVEELDETTPVAKKLSLRQRLERHRTAPACAACHRRMDPIGFGLENYDAIGAWRGKDGSKPIDTAGTFPDGTTFEGQAELKKILVTQRRDEFLRCLTEKMMTYALGRKLEYSDAPAVAKIVDQLKQDNYRFSTLVVGIVRSEPFRFAKAVALKNEN